MRRFSTFVALVAAITLSSCGYDDSGINNRLDELDNRLEKLEGTTLPSIDEQIESINTSIADLKVVDTELRQLIEALEADAEEHSELIATLQTKASELESKIATIEEYVDSEITATEDWATATFATLEQYAEVQSEISGLKALLEQNKSVITEAYTTAIAEAIATSESSMKEWVNEQLAGYYTIAETDAKLELLQRSIDTLSESLTEEVETLSGRIDTMKSELSEAYKAAITEAIETNNGVINAKIAEEISSVNSRIDKEVTSINARIDALEGRIKDLEEALDKIKALDIVFDIESGKACMAGSSIEFGYTIIGGDEDTEVESFGDGGWRADVTPTDATSGRVRVTAPKDGGNGKVIVLATSGVGASTMKSIRFDEGVITDILDSYEVDWEACTLEVKLRTNLDYTVRIPAEAQSWLSVADTRAALREDTLTFSIAENSSIDRTATIELIGEFGDVLQSFEIVQTNVDMLFICDNFTVTHSGFTVDVKPGKNNYCQWTYYVWTKSSYDSVSTEDIVDRSLWGIHNTNNWGIHIPLQTGSATICNYELLDNDSEYVLVMLYLDEHGYKYDNNYKAIPFKTLKPTPGAAATLDVSGPIIVKDGFSYTVNFIVKTNDNAVDLLAGAQLWNNYEFEKYWDPNDWSQIQAFFMFRRPVGEETLAAAKSAEGATISFTGFDKEDYVFFFEVLNAENTPTQFAVRVTPEMFK